MRPDKQLLSGFAILGAALCLIVLTWAGTLRAISTEEQEVHARVASTLGNQALTFSEQVGRQILELDQTLLILTRAWEADPEHFDLDAWRRLAVAMSGITRDVVLVDQNGVIRQSSIPEAIGQNVSDRDFFAYALEHTADDHLFIGAATIGPIMRQWHLSAARALHGRDGSFAGTIHTDYRVEAITDAFGQADVGIGGMVSLIGLNDGRVRAAVGPTTIDQNTSIADTQMLTAMRQQPSGIWTGPSAQDSVRRIHSFRQIPDRDLLLVVAMDEDEAMRPAETWRMQASIFAGCITALLLAMAFLLRLGLRQAGRREETLAEERATLAAANAQLEVARAHAAAKTEQLEATLAGMSDGVSMVDAHFCMMEWNARFQEIAGVPPDVLRVGLPMEEVLRAQARNGQFGVVDVEAEVERRMTLLRAGRFGTTERQRPDGRSLELRRNPLPDGGFVTLYSDITDRKRAELALRDARAMAEAANAAKSRFVAIVSHEIRTPLNALLNALRLLADSGMAPQQQSILDMARQSGDALSGLIRDILEMSRMEAGQLTLRPEICALRPLLDNAMTVFQSQAADRGITLNVEISPGVPNEVLIDPVRVRQVLLNLLSNAVKFASAGRVSLAVGIAGSTAQGLPILRLAVRDEGPAIPKADRDLLFWPFSRLDRPLGYDATGTGLGLAICHHLIQLMHGEIGCSAWETATGSHGNEFWITLPVEALPEPAPAPLVIEAADPAAERPPPRPLPRTRILLVDDVPANQLVTATLLRREGHQVDVVSSGEAAIRAVGKTPYDLVLMDIFMPGMTGPEAAQRIRAMPGIGRTVPIIALTADATNQDFSDAGIDGVLLKPVSPPELLAVLGRYAWQGFPGVQPLLPVNNEQTVQDMKVEQPILAEDRIEELRTHLPRATLVPMVEECLTDLENRLPALRNALQRGTGAAIAAHAHAMVGMAAGYGMASLESKLRAVMTAARDGETDGFDGTAAEVKIELDRTAIALRDALHDELA